MQNKSKIGKKITITFSLVSIIPALIIAALSIFFFKYAVDELLSEELDTTITESVKVAEGYLKEHKNNIKADILALANQLNANASELSQNKDKFFYTLRILSGIKQLTEANIVTYDFESDTKEKGITLMIKERSISLDHEIMRDASEGEVVVLEDIKTRLRAIVKLTNYKNIYLIVGRNVDAEVLQYLDNAKKSNSNYNNLKKDIKTFRWSFIAIFLSATALVLIIILIYGFYFSKKLTNPINNLITATNKVKEGDLSARIDHHKSEDYELANLGDSFNQMVTQLEEQKKKLRRAAWEDVARKIAHEIRNPLTPIKLAVSRLNSPKLTKENKEKYINTVNRQIDNINNIVDEFSNFARMPKANLARVELTSLIKEILTAQEVAHDKVTYISKIPKSVTNIKADANQLTQIFNNIYKNSAEAMGKKKGEIRTEITKGDLVTITIQDTGSGFTDEYLKKAFEPYITTKEKGTGLGLAITKRMVEEHNAQLHIANRYNKDKKIEGATVTIHFPT